MTATPLAGVRACVFDAYGTLFDVHSAVARHAGALGDRAGPISALWRRKQLEYSWLRGLMGAYVDFWQLTEDALDVALARHAVEDAALRTRLLAAYRELAPYPEVAGVLARLQEAGVTCAILSNGSPAMLDAAVDAAGLRPYFAAILSVDPLGVYKPDPRVYRLAGDTLGAAPDEIGFLSANAWDAHGAAAFGFRVVWVNRFHQPPERLPGTVLAETTGLDDLPALCGRG